MEFHKWFEENKIELDLESCDYDKACKIWNAALRTTYAMPHKEQTQEHIDLTTVYLYAAEETKSRYRKKLKLIQSMCGNANAAEGCRLIIKEIDGMLP